MSWKAFTKSLLFHSNKIVRRLKSFVLHAHPPPPPPHVVRRPPSSDELPAAADVTVCKVEGGLLMSPSTFPYFMLVALEAGGLFRGLLLLLLYPVLLLLGHDRATQAHGHGQLRRSQEGEGRVAVLPGGQGGDAQAVPGGRQRRGVRCGGAAAAAGVRELHAEGDGGAVLEGSTSPSTPSWRRS
ncbi:hypothetical protein OsJ_13245 [Oryza sativa Japonica Group]|uniref:Glycerol-3-phosphate acyltransferase RAM2/GPAT1-8 HAD-like domain-containing protein n=1 Tax=Oryza sativa subsp. japonica TaxID=39947 RepID=A3APE7_ORYSJ|nr:hypothetical protein OsJ_13245 [Oryza sativa Japonica Group]